MMFIRSAYWIALYVYYKACSEPVDSQVAVAHVIIARASKRQIPVEDVIKQKSKILRHPDRSLDDIKEHDAFVKCFESAVIAMDQRSGGNTLNGADHYHTNCTLPAWAAHMKVVAKIGKFIFYRA